MDHNAHQTIFLARRPRGVLAKENGHGADRRSPRIGLSEFCSGCEAIS